MLLRQGRTRLWTAFAVLNVSLLAYQIGDFLNGLFGTQPWPLRLTLAAAGFIPLAVLGFIVEFQGESAGRAGGLRRMAAFTGVATVAVALSPLGMIPAARVAAASAVFVLLTAAVTSGSAPRSAWGYLSASCSSASSAGRRRPSPTWR